MTSSQTTAPITGAPAGTARHAARRTRRSFLGLAAATVVGLWLGLAAPGTSPVSAPAAPAGTAADGTNDDATAPVVVPAPPVRGPGRGGRR